MNLFKKCFIKYGWACFYRRKIKSILEDNLHTSEPFKQIYTSWRYWCADPFIVEDKGKYYIFCELMDNKKLYGLLGLAELNPNGKTYVHPIKDFKFHISYPNVFKVKDEWYMIAETSKQKTIELYKSTNFPYKWEKVSILATNINAADTTVFVQDDKSYAFIYEQNYIYEQNCNLDKLSIAQLNLKTLKLENISQVAQYYTPVCRPAGNIFVEKGSCYRPAQLGIKEYGEEIIIYRFVFDPVNKKYKEEKIKSLSLDDFDKNLKNKGFRCCHTYNTCGDFEVIDTKYAKFSLLKPVYWIMRHLI